MSGLADLHAVLVVSQLLLCTLWDRTYTSITATFFFSLQIRLHDAIAPDFSGVKSLTTLRRCGVASLSLAFLYLPFSTFRILFSFLCMHLIFLFSFYASFRREKGDRERRFQ